MSEGARRILILSNFFTQGHGGTPESVLLLSRQFARLGLNCDVLCNRGLCRGAEQLEHLPSRGDNTAFVPSADLDLTCYEGVFVAGSWNMQAPAIVYRAVLAGIPVVYSAKGCLSRAEFVRPRDFRRIPYLLLVELSLLLLARRVVFTSRAERESCVVPRWIWRHKQALVPEPFEGPPAVGRPKRTVTTAGFMAEISPRKGLEELIVGFGAFLARNPTTDMRLKIAGAARVGAEGYLAHCKSLAAANGSDAHIEWCAPVRGRDRETFYASLDLFICPSQFESFGLTVLEALWQGTPVCAGPNLGVLEFLREDAPVIRLKALDEHEIAAGLGAFAAATAMYEEASAWIGQHACTLSNLAIGQSLAGMLMRAQN